MMTRRERLMATLRGGPVDRPAVSFYEIGGWTPDPDDPDPFNVFQGPGWRDLLRLAEEETDLIRMMTPELTPAPDNPRDAFRRVETYVENGSRYTRETWHVAGRELTSLTRRDRDVATTWTIEPLLESVEDVCAYLELPDAVFSYEISVANLKAAESDLGEAGIVMVDTHDPLCAAAGLFTMEGYTVMALTEPALFHRLLQKHARHLYARVATVAREFPGHLWRVVGSEYASEPFLPPSLYDAYEVRYTQPIIETIQREGGYARLHSHGRLRHILPYIAGMEVDGLDPIEPPPQGDMALIDVRRHYGETMVLFGNIEASEIENLRPDIFERRVRAALEQGTAGSGRGFVLMPSACPYGREINARVMTNYETMVRLAKAYGS
jgi:uroporphyrinogen-III decarboxylase